jgi:signal transduction histidine kinase
MQQAEQLGRAERPRGAVQLSGAEQLRGPAGADRKRVEAVVETLATMRRESETLAEVAHDARNMVTALGLYCDLLEEPGVLATPFLHYGSELRLVAAASHRLVEKLVALDPGEVTASDISQADGGFSRSGGSFSQAGLRIPAKPPKSGMQTLSSDRGHPGELYSDGLNQDTLRQNGLRKDSPNPNMQNLTGPAPKQPERSQHWEGLPAQPIDNLALELEATRSLLAALAGPSISLTLETEGCAKAVWLTGEDLTRVLVNLVKNAAEAMPAGGSIELGLREVAAVAGTPSSLTLAIRDNGPGIPPKALERVFEAGYTTHERGSSKNGSWPAAHRGLGLSITRAVIQGAGGQVCAVKSSQSGACIKIELPVRTLPTLPNLSGL